MSAEAIIEAGTRQAIAVRDFDAVDTCIVERSGNRNRLFDRVLMTDGMHTVTKGHVRYVYFPLIGRHALLRSRGKPRGRNVFRSAHCG